MTIGKINGFAVHVRVSPYSPFEEYLHRFIEQINRLPHPFSLKAPQPLDFPKPGPGGYYGRNLRGKFAVRSLTGQFVVSPYRDRELVRHEHLIINFPGNVMGLIDPELLSTYIFDFASNFRVSTAFVQDGELNDYAREVSVRLSNLQVRWRYQFGMEFGVSEFHVSHFWTRQFCERTWGLSLEVVRERIEDVVYYTKCTEAGVFYYAFDHAPTLDELVAFNRVMRSRLGGYGLFNEVVDPNWNPISD